MNPTEQKSLWPAVLLVVGILGFWLGWRQLEPVLANRKPLPTVATASFSDGVRLEVYDVTLGIETGRVNVKAKTAEKMGPVGEGRAIEARAVGLLQSRG